LIRDGNINYMVINDWILLP